MNWTAEDFARYIDNEWRHSQNTYMGSGSEGFFYRVWYDNAVIPTPFGDVRKVDSSTDYDEGREERSVIISVGDRFFKKVGYYDSWNDSSWDGGFVEVRQREKTVTVYETI